MYGFGDDRNPATDTVNVMEEILVEFIVDVVRSSRQMITQFMTPREIVPNGRRTTAKDPAVHRRPAAGFIKAGRCKKACSNGRTIIHARGYQTRSRTIRRIGHQSSKGFLNVSSEIPSFCFNFWTIIHISQTIAVFRILSNIPMNGFRPGRVTAGGTGGEGCHA